VPLLAERVRRSGPPQTSAAPELIDSGFSIECDDAPYLHDGLNLADIAHILDLARRKILPESAELALLQLLLEVVEIDVADFPYDPNLGEPYNSREWYFADRLGDVAGWLHAGRPRREAARIALRLYLRRQIAELALSVTNFAADVCTLSLQHATTLMADQTYLQQAQPSTFGHYLLSFAQPALRDARRLLDELARINSSPGGAGCVNGTRLQDDRSFLAESLSFDAVIEHTRDAMWRVDDLISVMATAASVVSNLSKLAEDLEIFSSSEFDFVDLDDSFSRSSVLMPQKRNPYALSIVRGASGVLIGRLSGFLAVTKSPSARSDNFIFAYGEVPRALDLSQRVTRLMSGVVRTLKVHPDRMESELYRGYAQSTDLAEYLTVSCGVDYRTAYVVVGNAVREASKAGIPGRELTVEMINAAAQAHAGSSWNIGADELAQILDARQIVNSRQAVGGAAPEAFAAMIASSSLRVNELRDLAQRKLAGYDAAETELLDRARATARRTGDETPSRDSH
jgi:argininosuccinate lyase